MCSLIIFCSFLGTSVFFHLYEMIFANIPLGNLFIFTLFAWADCTDGNTTFGCDSDKNSLVFIYMF